MTRPSCCFMDFLIASLVGGTKFQHSQDVIAWLHWIWKGSMILTSRWCVTITDQMSFVKNWEPSFKPWTSNRLQSLAMTLAALSVGFSHWNFLISWESWLSSVHHIPTSTGRRQKHRFLPIHGTTWFKLVKNFGFNCVLCFIIFPL